MLVDINLLPQKERDRPAFVIAAISILLLAVILGAVLFFMARANADETAELNAQSAEIATEQALLRQQLEASQGLNEEQQLQATVEWAESYQYDTIPLLAELVSKLPERGFFNSFSYIEPNAATLTVQFDTSREAAYYLTQLKASELVASVTLDSVTNQELATTANAEEDVTLDEEALIENPRYLATYSLVFVDDRLPVEGTAEAEAVVEEAGTVEEPAEEVIEEDAEVQEENVNDAEAVSPGTEGDGNE